MYPTLHRNPVLRQQELLRNCTYGMVALTSQVSVTNAIIQDMSPGAGFLIGYIYICVCIFLKVDRNGFSRYVYVYIIPVFCTSIIIDVLDDIERLVLSEIRRSDKLLSSSRYCFQQTVRCQTLFQLRKRRQIFFLLNISSIIDVRSIQMVHAGFNPTVRK